MVLIIHCSEPFEHALISYVQHPTRSHGRVAVAILHCKQPGASDMAVSLRRASKIRKFT